jgi:hypothetical protein
MHSVLSQLPQMYSLLVRIYNHIFSILRKGLLSMSNDCTSSANNELMAVSRQTKQLLGVMRYN